MPSTFLMMETDCGVLNSKLSYESESCDEHLPYICKKSVSPPPTDKTGRSSSPFPCYILKSAGEAQIVIAGIIQTPDTKGTIVKAMVFRRLRKSKAKVASGGLSISCDSKVPTCYIQ